MEIFLLPVTIGKYVFSAIVWVLLFTIITQTDKYYDTRDWCLEKYEEYKERKSARRES